MKHPANRFLSVLLFLLFCYLSFDFIKDAKKDFFVLNYNWSQSNIKPIGNLSVVDYEVNKLTTENKIMLSTQKTHSSNLMTILILIILQSSY